MSRARRGGPGPSRRWENWARTEQAGDLQVLRPADEAEVADVIAAAARAGRAVKAVGSGHSFSGIAVPSQVCLRLDRLSGVRPRRPGGPLVEDDGTVTVGAGTTVADLDAELATLGRALANLGDIDAQTIAGATATGTHGTGAAYGGLAAQVAGLELVGADGQVHVCDGEQDPELFAAARVGLGALGVVTAVRLHTVPLFALRAEEGPMALDELLGSFDELAAATDHFEAYWFPHTRRALVKRSTRLPLEEGLDRLASWREWLDDELLSNTVFAWLVGVGRTVPGLIPTGNRLAARALGARTFTDLSYRVFTSPRRVRFREMEYAVPAEAATEAVADVVAAVSSADLKVAFPVELRVAAADDIWLSTAAGRPSAYVAVHVPAAVDHRRYFALVASILDGYAGRPHWGKLHRLTAAQLRPRYPDFDRFVAVRDHLDPAGTFANAYLDRVLGPPPRAAR